MRQNSLQIDNLGQAYQFLKEMGIAEVENFPEGQLGRWKKCAQQALKAAIEQSMHSRVERYLQDIREKGGKDRRNGSYHRSLLTALGVLDIEVPRTRTYSPIEILKAYSQRTQDVDALILAAFLLGLSTRKVSEALLPILGVPVSPALVSKIAKTLDEVIERFHKRPLSSEPYRALLLDGVVLKRKTGMGSQKVFFLVAMGILEDGSKEIIDFRPASSESERAWEKFLNSLYARGLTGEGIEMLSVDGCPGLLNAVDTVYSHVPLQRCWAHKTRNITKRVRKKDIPEVKKDLKRIYESPHEKAARKEAGNFARKWQALYPGAVQCLKKDLDELLAFFAFQDPKWRKMVRTTNAIERRFLEVKRRTRPMGVFSNKTSMERIVFAVMARENLKQGVWTSFEVTQKC